MTYANGQTDSTAYDTSSPNSPLTLTIASGSASQSGVLSGSGSIIKDGLGSLTLTAANSYSGNTTITAGTLALAGPATLGQDALHLTGGATLDLGGTSQTVTGLGNYANGAIGNITAGTLVSTGNVFIQSGTFANTFAGSSANAYLLIGGDVNATVLLNGTNDAVNTHDTTQVVIGLPGASGPAGTVKLGHAHALAAATENVGLYVGTLDLNGQTNVRANALVLYGTESALVNNSPAETASYAGGVNLLTGSVRIGGAGTLTLSGVLGGAGGVTKTGAGTLTLSGANTYTGATTVSAGKLVLDGSIASGVLTVAAGATLGGSGALGGATTMAGTLSPGNSAGLMTFNNALTLESTGTVVMELGGHDRGTQYDAIDVWGTLTYGGTLQVTGIDGFTVGLGDTFHLFDSIVSAGMFDQVLLPSLDSGLFWDSSALHTAGVLSVSAVPEPSTLALLGGLLALGFVVARRRQKSPTAT